MATKQKDLKLKDLLVQKINVLYDIESELIKALPKMAKAATDSDLKKGFEDHLKETKKQKERLEEAHEILGATPKKLKAEAIRGLVTDGDWVIKNVKPKEAMSASLARAAQYVEHYEMAGYMAAIDWAESLGENEVAELLSKNLEEEVAADEKLSMTGNKIDLNLI
jgi:ferritin-like metal-binding protein YciE